MNNSLLTSPLRLPAPLMACEAPADPIAMRSKGVAALGIIGGFMKAVGAWLRHTPSLSEQILDQNEAGQLFRRR